MPVRSEPDLPWGVYIQVPFCTAKCTYCNFPTGVVAPSWFGPYVEAVCREIGQHRALYQRAGLAGWTTVSRKIPVDTLYVGGGTPGLLGVDGLARLLAAVRESFDCRWIEATLEADPHEVTEPIAAAWRALGFNRISLGVQSLHDGELRAVGRRHRPQEVSRAVMALRTAGFDNFSFDLIVGLPGQSLASWQATLAQAIALEPPHLSIYLLELDEASRLGREALAGGTRYGADRLPSDDEMASCYEFAQQRLAEAGYQQYEISNWALPGYASRHNQKYWWRHPYLGFGAGAHSFDGQQRWANVESPERYLRAISRGEPALAEQRTLSAQAALEEEIFLGLRCRAGIRPAELARRYGVDLSVAVERLCRDGLLESIGDAVRIPPHLLTVANEIIVRMLAEVETRSGVPQLACSEGP